jgi:hypothetical protein
LFAQYHALLDFVIHGLNVHSQASFQEFAGQYFLVCRTLPSILRDAWIAHVSDWLLKQDFTLKSVFSALHGEPSVLSFCIETVITQVLSRSAQQIHTQILVLGAGIGQDVQDIQHALDLAGVQRHLYSFEQVDLVNYPHDAPEIVHVQWTGVSGIALYSIDIIIGAWVVGLTHATELNTLIQQLIMRLAPDGKLILGEHANEIYARNALKISHQYLQDMSKEDQVQSSVMTHSPDHGRYPPYLCSRVEATARQETIDHIKLPANMAGDTLPVCEYADNDLEYVSTLRELMTRHLQPLQQSGRCGLACVYSLLTSSGWEYDCSTRCFFIRTNEHATGRGCPTFAEAAEAHRIVLFQFSMLPTETVDLMRNSGHVSSQLVDLVLRVAESILMREAFRQ